MVKTGSSIVLSENESIEFLKTARDTNGDMLEVRVKYKPHSPRPDPHFHPNQEEQFYIYRGIFHTNIDGNEVTYRPGDSFTVPHRAAHWMHNTSDEVGELVWQIRPALKREAFFETMWSMRKDRKFGKNGPNLLQTAVLLAEYEDDYRESSLPFLLKGVSLTVLARIGRAFGYPAYYSAEPNLS